MRREKAYQGITIVNWDKIMVLQINEDHVLKCNFAGRGGREELIIPCFKNKLVKKSGKLFDCIDIENNEKYELKKQKNEQWLDPRKFFNLTKEEGRITMVFVLWDSSGHCNMIATMSTADFAERAFSLEKLQDANNYAKKYPKDQIKSGIKIRELINNNKDVVKIIWKSKK